MLPFYRSLLSCFLVLGCATADAQSGCTDPEASNYNAFAITNDGSCVYPVTHSTPILRGVLNAIITESSGLEWTDGKLWTHNDSGNLPEIYSIDTVDGHTLQTVVVDNYPNVDWEDITADSLYIYIGDHGNNAGDRTDLKVLKIAKADITSGVTVHVNAQAISFSYTDQTSFVPSSTHNFDCEALMSIKDSLYIFTKDRGDGQSRVYKMSKTPGTYALTPYTSYNVDGLVTGADYNATTHEIILIGYKPGHTNSFLWLLSNYSGDMFFSGNKRRIEIGNGLTWQTEGVCWLSASRFFVSCETTDDVPASLYIDNTAWVPTSVKSIAASVSPVIYPNPVTGLLHAYGMLAKVVYAVINAAGETVLSGYLDKGDNTIKVSDLLPGIYSMQVTEVNGARSATSFEKK